MSGVHEGESVLGRPRGRQRNAQAARPRRRGPRVAHLTAMIATAALFGTNASVACDLQIEATDDIVLDGGDAYDVFAGGATSQRARVLVRRVDVGTVANAPIEDDDLADTDDATDSAPEVDMPSVAAPATTPCSALIRVDSIGSNVLAGAGGTLAYRLAPGDRRVEGDGGSLRLRVDGLEPGDAAELRYDLVIPGDQFVAEGTYGAELAVSVDPWDGGSFAGSFAGGANVSSAGDRTTASVRVSVAGAARISFAGTTGRRRVVDFGDLRTGATPIVPVAIVVQASAPYTLRFASDNGGQLVHDTQERRWTVPYALQVGGQSVDLASGESRLQRGRATGAAGDRMPLDFRIVDAEDRIAGTYRDRLEVEITPASIGF